MASLFPPVEAKFLVSSMLYTPSQLKLTSVSCLCSPSCFRSVRITNVGTMSGFFYMGSRALTQVLILPTEPIPWSECNYVYTLSCLLVGEHDH